MVFASSVARCQLSGNLNGYERHTHHHVATSGTALRPVWYGSFGFCAADAVDLLPRPAHLPLRFKHQPYQRKPVVPRKVALAIRSGVAGTLPRKPDQSGRGLYAVAHPAAAGCRLPGRAVDPQRRRHQPNRLVQGAGVVYGYLKGERERRAGLHYSNGG